MSEEEKREDRWLHRGILHGDVEEFGFGSMTPWFRVSLWLGRLSDPPTVQEQGVLVFAFQKEVSTREAAVAFFERVDIAKLLATTLHATTDEHRALTHRLNVETRRLDKLRALATDVLPEGGFQSGGSNG